MSSFNKWMFKKNCIIHILSDRVTVKVISVLATSLNDNAYWRRLLTSLIGYCRNSNVGLTVSNVANTATSNKRRQSSDITNTLISNKRRQSAIAPIRNILSSNCEHNIGYFLPYIVCCLLYVEVLGSFLNFPFSREWKQKQTSEEPSYFVII